MKYSLMHDINFTQRLGYRWPVTYFTMEVNTRLAKPPLNYNDGLAKFDLPSSVK